MLLSGIELKIARLKVGIKQFELAARLGIGPSQLSQIETGRQKPSPELAKQIEEILQEEQVKSGVPQH